MIELWLGIALLTLAAIAIVFWPLLKNRQAAKSAQVVTDRLQENIAIFRERLQELESERQAGTLTDEHFAELKLELERNLLIDAERHQRQEPVLQLGQAQLISVVLVALMVPAVSIGLYTQLGRADDLQIALEAQRWADPFDGREPSLEEAITLLEKELTARPQNPEGWYMLATTYMGLQQYDQAVASLEQVLEHLPETHQDYTEMMGRLANARYAAAGATIDEGTQQLLQDVLRRDAENVTALSLVGLDAFEQGDFTTAIVYWQRAQQNANPQEREALGMGILRAQMMMDGGQTPAPEAETAPPVLQIELDVAEEIMTEIRSDQTVYVLARPVGERMPITVVRLQVGELPLTLALDDRNSMMPDVRLSDFAEVDLVARISLSGLAEEQPGDFKGTLSSVKVSAEAEPVRLLISEQVK